MQDPAQHLVIVRYDENQISHNEWVFNTADIDRSRVVWARDMGEAQNLELIRYFKDRKVWLLEPDMVPPKLSAYVTPAVFGSPPDRAHRITERHFPVNKSIHSKLGHRY